MRRASGSQGIFAFAVLRARGVSRARTWGVTDRWVPRSSRKYQNHKTAHASVIGTSRKKAARQPNIAISPATISAVAALPTREKVWVMPCAKPQRVFGVQAD